MSKNKPAPRPKELRIKPKASEWARQKLEAEAAERAPDDDDALRQISLRMPVEDVAFVGAIAKRFGVSRNQAMCLLIASACGDVYEELPYEERKRVLEAVEKDLGRPVRPHWVRDPPKSGEDTYYEATEEQRREWEARSSP